MEKLLLELNVNSNCFLNEIQQIMYLSNKAIKCLEIHEATTVEAHNKTEEIVRLNKEEQDLIMKLKDQENQCNRVLGKLEDLNRKIDELNRFDEYKFNNITLEYQLKLFGITTETQFLKPNVAEFKISFWEEIFVLFNYDFIDNSFDLHQIEPNPIGFDNIQLLLLESKDIEGFLYSVRNKLRKQNEFQFLN